MPRLAFLVVSSVILLSSVSAQALDFTTSASATLTFSGIQTELFQPIGDARNTVVNDQGFGFVSENFPINLPGTGAAEGTENITQVFSSASLVGSGFAYAFAADEVLLLRRRSVGRRSR